MVQTTLESYIAGMFDGDGCVMVPVIKSDSTNINYRVEPKALIIQHYLAGLFDADGYVSAKITTSQGSTLDHRVRPEAQIEMAEYNPIIDKLNEYSDQVGFESHVYRRDGREGNQSAKFRWEVRGIDNVVTFLNSIKDHTIVKRKQIEIIVNHIIPIIESGDHLTKRGFLRVMYWKDRMDTMKGGNRGKYDLEYFEELWGMTIEVA